MKRTSKKFRIELGINLHAAPVPQTNPNMRIFPLQNALVDITRGEAPEHARAAWYSHLRAGDEICFRIVDISSLRVPGHEPNYPSMALAEFYFNNPVTGRPANPFEEDVVEWRFSDRLEDQRSPVYSLNAEHLLPTWDLVGRSGAGEEYETLKFADFSTLEEVEGHHKFRAFELTVAIKMADGGWMNHYVFDPEMIVSETESEGDGGGGKGGGRL